MMITVTMKQVLEKKIFPSKIFKKQGKQVRSDRPSA